MLAGPYRTAAQPVVRVVRSAPWWARWVCLVRGHRWRVLRSAGKTYLWNLHPHAGDDCMCRRCGELWLDYDRAVELEQAVELLVRALRGDQVPAPLVKLATRSLVDAWRDYHPRGE